MMHQKSESSSKDVHLKFAQDSQNPHDNYYDAIVLNTKCGRLSFF